MPSDLGGSFFDVIIFFCLFNTDHGVLVARTLEWFAVPSSSGPHFVRTCNYDLSVLVALHSIAYSFAELCKTLNHNKAVIYERAQPGEVFKFFSLLNKMVVFG